MPDNDQSNNTVKPQSLGVNDRLLSPIPERHGCVTAWLMLMLIGNSLCILSYSLLSSRMEQILKISLTAVILIIAVSVINLIFSIMLFRWKKVGFYGLAITAIFEFVMNICIGLKFIPCLLGLFGIVILFGIFQIKKGGRSAWYYLK